MANTPEKPNLDRLIIDFHKQIAVFNHGSCWLGDGAFDDIKDIPAEVLLNQKDFGLFLNSTFDEISDLGENPGKEESKVAKFKTTNFLIEGKRSNTIELTLIGLNQARKDWLETQLNKEIRTIALLSADKANCLVFNAMRWSYERSNEFNGLYTATISTEFSGPTKDRYFIIDGIPETAV
ncbi:hypothetical protein [Maridesulfovibrio ferrireducens]|uniref:hypothetical protein n=1 Tax=Maridesulfovibrio ferrireducens TaxID=246191 RepID=UPI001A2171EC|nr:hypothetical protein [Maridesulfovibrio ferrireducens]MBI9113214.1 hypothetical protein [Maridesulfovibrio ferrireducens]